MSIKKFFLMKIKKCLTSNHKHDIIDLSKEKGVIKNERTV